MADEFENIPGTAEPAEDTDVTVEEKVEEPHLYKVILHNDDYTTGDFVIQILRDIFLKTREEATDLMMAIDREGSGVCGIYPKNIAEYRVARVQRRAKEACFPLLCTMERE